MIAELIRFNEEKLTFMETYLDINAMIHNHADSQNLSSVRDLVEKKRGLIVSIDVIDDKILKSMQKTKEDFNVSDFGDLSSQQEPDLKTLKITAGKVLKKMVEIKTSDESIKSIIDEAFKTLKTSKRPIDVNKLYYYTNEYFKGDNQA